MIKSPKPCGAPYYDMDENKAIKVQQYLAANKEFLEKGALEDILPLIRTSFLLSFACKCKGFSQCGHTFALEWILM